MFRDPKVPEAIIKELRRRGFTLDTVAEDGALENYLGIGIEKNSKGELVLKQQGLIDRIIECTGLQEASIKHTPASDVLARSLDSKPFDCHYNYRSAAGMLSYLSGTTRLDTCFATHQICRFSANPREPHHVALKQIVQYLKKTRDEGMVIRPLGTKSNKLTCYTDSDFAGLYSKEDPQDPTSTRSRTGFVICIGDNPIYWSSKLQSLTASSTLEAEYVACSTAMKALVFLREIHIEVCEALQLDYDPVSNISTIFMDNQAALILATTDPPRCTPKSKAIAVHYHWFREHLTPSTIIMKYIESKSNRSNILTKPLPRAQFEAERFLTMGF
jgi:hypothetical protein